MRSAGLSALVSDAALLSNEAQDHLAGLYGDHDRWDVDLAAGDFSMTGPKDSVHFGVQFVGSAAPGPASWLWSWANPSGASAGVTSAAEAAREWGTAYGIDELTSSEIPFDDYASGDDSGEPGTGLGHDLWLATKLAGGLFFGYTAQVQGGTRVWFLLDGPVLPEPTVAATLRALTSTLAQVTIEDHARALSSYATLRGIAWDGSVLHLPDGGIEVRLEDGRIAGYSATAT